MQKPKKEEFVYKPVSIDRYNYKGPLKKAISIAEHYGFQLIEPVTITKRLPATITKSKKEFLKARDFSLYPKNSMSILKKYIDDKMDKYSPPIMLCHVVDKGRERSELRLEIIGTKKSVAEAMVLKTATIILKDLGHGNTGVRLNSIGDKESAQNFIRELTAYYRNHMNHLPPAVQHQIKKDIFRVLGNKNDKYKEIHENAPRPVSFLSEESRNHLKEILEFIETFGMHYEIRSEMVGSRLCFPKTAYEIRDESRKRKRVLAKGERYNHLAQSIGLNKKVPIVGIGIKIKRKGSYKDSYKKMRTVNTPKIYFVHIGFDAKIRSLDVLEILRASGVPIYQSLCTNSFANQLKKAETLNVPYMMIIGQKEVLENSVIFRDTSTRYQKNVSISDLPNFLQKLKKKKTL